jgi:hypothetical protein
MPREAPDSFFYREIRDFNIEFLALLGTARQASHGSVFGLERSLIEQIGQLPPPALEAMATTPCMLASLAGARRSLRTSRLAEPPPPADPGWEQEVRVFAARFVTYAWQVARRDSLHAVLCVGTAAASLMAQTSYRELHALSGRPTGQIEARFSNHPRFWSDLTYAARAGRADELALSRLAAIQLATAEFEALRRPGDAGPGSQALAARA